jgi:hypothetical protein
MSTADFPVPLPCPFCGYVGLDFSEQGSTFRWGTASCEGCGATVGETRKHEDWHRDAINAWNRRATPTPPVEPVKEADVSEQIATLERENDLLRQHAAKQITDATLMTGLVVGNGDATLGLEGGACGLLVEQFAQQFKDGGGINYLELKFESQSVLPGKAFVVTLQRVRGETPTQQLKRARARIAELEADVSAIRDAALEAAALECMQVDEIGEGPDCWGWHAKDYARAIRALRGGTP